MPGELPGERANRASSEVTPQEICRKFPLEEFPNWTISAGERYYVRAPLDRFGEISFHIRSHITMLILSGNPAIQFLQAFRSSGLTLLAKIFSRCGLEEFFFTLIVSQIWLFDSKLGRLLAILLSLGFFVTGSLKNMLCLPRPPAPPALRLSEEDGDWAWPSNHALMGTAFPWFIWLHASKYYELSVTASIVLLAVVLTWNCGVMWSRVYLGVHSPCDIVAGWMIGVLLLFVFQGFADKLYALYEYASASDASYFVYFWFLAVVLLWIHPRCWPETQSYGESICVLSGAAAIWSTRMFQLDGVLPHQSLMEASPDAPIYAYFTRFFIGVVAILCARLITKPMAKLSVSLMLKCANIPYFSYSEMVRMYGRLMPTKRFTQRLRFKPVPGDKTILPDTLPLDMDIFVKFIVYSMVGTMVGEVCPALFIQLGV